jgi:SsrA-binding protein
MSAATRKPDDGNKVVAENRKARYDFHILETLEAGLVLTGTEVKSMRAGQAAIREAYVRVDANEAWVIGMSIATYEQGNLFNHEQTRTRKLLLHRREIDDLHVHVTRKGNTLVPISLYFKGGRAKLLIGVAKGKDKGDKRQAIMERDTKRQVDREIREARR